MRAAEKAYGKSFTLYESDNPDMRFDPDQRPAYWARRAREMKLGNPSRARFIALLEKKATRYETRLHQFEQDKQKSSQVRARLTDHVIAATDDRLAKAKAAEAAKEAEEAKTAKEVKEAEAAEARRAQAEQRARLKADGDELRQLVDTLQPASSRKRKSSAVSPPARKVWSLFGTA